MAQGSFEVAAGGAWLAVGIIVVLVFLLLGVPAIVLLLARRMQHGPAGLRDGGGSHPIDTTLGTLPEIDVRPKGEARQQIGPVRTKQVLAHLSGFCAMIGIPSFLGPVLTLLLVGGDQSVAPHAKAAFNFHLTAWVYGVVGIVLVSVLTMADGRAGLIVSVLGGSLFVATTAIATATGAHRAYHGELWRYPLAIRFLK